MCKRNLMIRSCGPQLSKYLFVYIHWSLHCFDKTTRKKLAESFSKPLKHISKPKPHFLLNVDLVTYCILHISNTLWCPLMEDVGDYWTQTTTEGWGETTGNTWTTMGPVFDGHHRYSWIIWRALPVLFIHHLPILLVVCPSKISPTGIITHRPTLCYSYVITCSRILTQSQTYYRNYGSGPRPQVLRHLFCWQDMPRSCSKLQLNSVIDYTQDNLSLVNACTSHTRHIANGMPMYLQILN